jgi:hypothetical protein
MLPANILGCGDKFGVPGHGAALHKEEPRHP